MNPLLYSDDGCIDNSQIRFANSLTSYPVILIGIFRRLNLCSKDVFLPKQKITGLPQESTIPVLLGMAVLIPPGTNGMIFTPAAE